MTLRKSRNSTFKLIKEGAGHYIDPNHFMGQSSMDADHKHSEADKTPKKKVKSAK